ARDLGRLQRFFRERGRVFVVLDDVDLLAAQLADDGLHAHALHSNAGANGINVLIFGHHGDLRTLAGFTRDRADHDGAIVDLRNFRLEQVLYQLRRGARDDHARAFARTFHANDHNPNAFTDGERFQARLFFARGASFGFAEIKNEIRAFLPLHGSVDDLAHASDVLVVNRVALGFAHLLEDHLLRDLCRNTAQSRGIRERMAGAVEAHFTSDLSVLVFLTGVFQRDLDLRIFHLVVVLDDGLDRVHLDRPGFRVEHAAQVFLRLQIFARRYRNGVFDRADHDLRV